jgi:hypothetical protein
MRWISLKIHSDARRLMLAHQESCAFNSLTPLLTALPRFVLATPAAVGVMVLRSDKCLSIVSPWRTLLRWLIGDRYGSKCHALVPVETNWFNSVLRVIIANYDQIQRLSQQFLTHNASSLCNYVN